MDLKKTFLCVAVVVLLLNGGKGIWDLINISENSSLTNTTLSLAYKIGVIARIFLEIIVNFGLVKIIYDTFLKKVL